MGNIHAFESRLFAPSYVSMVACFNAISWSCKQSSLSKFVIESFNLINNVFHSSPASVTGAKYTDLDLHSNKSKQIKLKSNKIKTEKTLNLNLKLQLDSDNILLELQKVSLKVFASKANYFWVNTYAVATVWVAGLLRWCCSWRLLFHLSCVLLFSLSTFCVLFIF